MAYILGRGSGSGGGGGGGAPSGPAGGSLGGTYPNPTLSAAKQAELDGKVPKSLYDANTVLAANSDDTPAAVTMGASTILARLAAGNIKAASVSEIQTLLGTPYPYVLLQDQRTANTAGGTSTPGSWETRTVQTEVVDASGICTLSSNQFTLSAGTYRINAWASIVNGGQCKNRLQNVTGTATLLLGGSDFGAAAGGNAWSPIAGTFTVAASQALEIQSRVTAGTASAGYGIASNFAVTEIYVNVELWKIA